MTRTLLGEALIEPDQHAVQLWRDSHNQAVLQVVNPAGEVVDSMVICPLDREAELATCEYGAALACLGGILERLPATEQSPEGVI